VTQFAARCGGADAPDARAIFEVVITECDLVVSWRARPRSFVALMGVYESNYLRLAALAGNLLQLCGSRISDVEGDCILVLSVLERARYTADLRLTYLLPDEQRSAEPARVPDLRMRLYHDARLLEARCVGGAGPERELDRCWARNMMLNKWLEYCAERGHCLADPHHS
jgi:uncharacterized protein YqiB (DUF1249 family)